MQMTQQQEQAIKRIATSGDAGIIIDLYKNIISYYADVRQMTNVSPEEVRGRQIACDILQNEIINKLSVYNTPQQIINDNYD